ncbi:MAG TPA: hypothetical protein VN750_19495 [Steroidobacteraceae bacterium]|nr:hypothetical protein [Steroidobacteraceae bacterium]
MQHTKPAAYLGIVFAALTACGVKEPQTGKPGSPTPAQSIQLLRQLHQIAGQANQAAPAAIDENTRLDGARVGPGLKLTSTYTLVNAKANGIDSTTFQAKLTPVIKDASCTNSELRPLIDQGVVVVLEYRGLDGSPIGTLSIDRDTCGASR